MINAIDKQTSSPPLGWCFEPFTAAWAYFFDAAQRHVLFWDVMRQRGNQYREHLAETVPHVLDYETELVLDGRDLDRPANYGLVRIVPPAGTDISPTKRPFVIVDPRAGHGPGIGGFKADSEIGVALKAGHPCYFVGFLPDPIPGQTIGDIAQAEAIFLEKVIALHPQAEGKPCVIGNCQAGWAVMMVAALRPELFGPIIIAGSPLSYWAGVHGVNPMRYTGGLVGGSWATAFLSDLGNGKFDGAWLVKNFESLNPSNTFWTKSYNLYSKIDTEAPRYLGFERWWGGHVNLNAQEIQFIVDDLFVGNKLTAGQIQASDGTVVDLRNIRSPIVVFCSKGDNITPPQQALGWISDLYDSVEDIRSFGQTIVYTIHESVGHLGIFVSAGVARKEHGELSSNIDLIDTLPPGLYEAVFEEKVEDTVNPSLAQGNWVMRCEARAPSDIRALGGNDADDDRCFATAARISERNLALYRTLAQPFVRSFVGAPFAEFLRKLHPLRLQYDLFTDANPLLAPLGASAEWVRANRRAPEPDNVFLAVQRSLSESIVAALDAWRDVRDAAVEGMFFSLYGSPALQAAVGIELSSGRPAGRMPRTAFHKEFLRTRVAELKSRISVGGLREAVIRALLYAGMGRNAIDERGFEAVRRIRRAQADVSALSLPAFKLLVREQFLMLLLDQDAALAAIPSMIPADSEGPRRAFGAIKDVLSARGPLSTTDRDRLSEIERLFGLESSSSTFGRWIAVQPAVDPPLDKAS